MPTVQLNKDMMDMSTSYNVVLKGTWSRDDVRVRRAYGVCRTWLPWESGLGHGGSNREPLPLQRMPGIGLATEAAMLLGS